MPLTGGCHCGAVRYEVAGEPLSTGICHCVDCRRVAGAPMVAWAIFRRSAVQVVQGMLKTYVSSPGAERQFCDACGSSLFYRNVAATPDQIDVQTATLDDPEALPPEKHVQTAEQIAWATRLHKLPAYERWKPSP